MIGRGQGPGGSQGGFVMNRVRATRAAVQFEAAGFDLAAPAREERLAPATAGLLILALSLSGWLAILLAGRLLIG
jgi:hypothetical protein